MLRAQRNYLAAQHPTESLCLSFLSLSNDFWGFGERNPRCEHYLSERKSDILNNP